MGVTDVNDQNKKHIWSLFIKLLFIISQIILKN